MTLNRQRFLMQRRKHPENKYILRLKGDYQHFNPTLRDPVIFIVFYTQYLKSSKKLMMYPKYNFITKVLLNEF